MRNWREIRSAIYHALSDYDCEVWYEKPSGRGWNARCSYFTISINEEYDSDDIEEALEDVADEYSLTIDWDSDEDVDLNADWDCND